MLPAPVRCPVPLNRVGPDSGLAQKRAHKRLLGGLPNPEPCTESFSASIVYRLQQNHGYDSVIVIAFGPPQLSLLRVGKLDG
jgi:hypothetical protein